MKIKLNIGDSYFSNGIYAAIEIIFIYKYDRLLALVNNGEVSDDKISRILSFVKDVSEVAYNGIVKDMLEWAAMISLLDGVDQDVADKIYNFILSATQYNEEHNISEVEFILDNISTTLVAGAVGAGLVNPARAFASLPSECREKVAEATWTQRLVAEYDDEGNPLVWREKTMVYISYKIKVPEILDIEFTAVRCICPSTGQTHWLLVPERLIKNPRAAVAWTCMIPRALLDRGCYVIKRQGDVFLFELTEGLSNEEVKEMIQSELVHHPEKTFWERYVDEA
ncbi:MAG: hypothetical protein D6711_10180 [Chloroflexi bacterium]|nr:MAG: hypothetical protein D6711_10180 [Chloroflexota bacterium]